MFNTQKLFCEDHFTPVCFERNHVAESLFFHDVKKLKPDDVPSRLNTTKQKKGQESKKIN